MSGILRILLPLAALAVLAAGEAARVQRPFVLMTREQAAELRQRIESDPLAKRQLETMTMRDAKLNPALIDCFRWLVLGDEAAAKRQKAELLKCIGAQPETDVRVRWVVGNSSATDRHMRDERTMDVWRYDSLYDLLTPAERAGVEETFRTYIDFHLSGHRPWHPDFRYDRTSWLPNMHYPRTIGTHLMAAALGDPELVRQVFEGLGGLKWWFDEYLGDGVFYMEEFAKYYSNIGSMIQWCEAVEKLGLERYGWQYQGRNGGSMRGFLEMMVWVALPGVEDRAGALTFDAVSMGDAGTFRVIEGYTPDGKGGPSWFTSANMNGPVPKMGAPFWFEALHAQFPREGYDFFLAKFARPGETHYLPSLYFGCRPVEVASVAKGPPAPSYVTRGRGFAMLRAEESGAYWTSPKPAVAFQFAMYYVHYVHDCLSLLGFTANRRRMYERLGGVGPGYAGGEPWKDSARGQAAGITVDCGQPRYVDSGNAGCRNQRIRESLKRPDHKFVACRAPGVWPEVDMERMLVLTDQYLCDVARLVSPRPRTYDWQVNANGALEGREAWTPTGELDGGKLYDPAKYEQIRSEHVGEDDLGDARRTATGAAAWTATIRHHPPAGATGPATAVRVHLLPEAPTVAFTGSIPGAKHGTALILRRQTAATAFAVVHEPLAAGAAPVLAAERLAQSDDGVLVRVRGGGVDDRIALVWGDAAGRPVTLAGDGDSLTCVGHAFVRVQGDRVEAGGDLRALRLKVAGTATLLLDGAAVAGATIADGVLTWSR